MVLVLDILRLPSFPVDHNILLLRVSSVFFVLDSLFFPLYCHRRFLIVFSLLLLLLVVSRPPPFSVVHNVLLFTFSLSFACLIPFSFLLIPFVGFLVLSIILFLLVVDRPPLTPFLILLLVFLVLPPLYFVSSAPYTLNINQSLPMSVYNLNVFNFKGRCYDSSSPSLDSIPRFSSLT